MFKRQRKWKKFQKKIAVYNQTMKNGMRESIDNISILIPKFQQQELRKKILHWIYFSPKNGPRESDGPSNFIYYKAFNFNNVSSWFPLDTHVEGIFVI